MTCGVVYVTYGLKAKAEAQRSIISLKRHNDLSIAIIDEQLFPDNSFGARWAKLNIDQLVNYEKVLYLDADTRILGDITPGFNYLDDWDIAIVPSENQDSNVFKHIRAGERLQTLKELGYLPLQLQAGVIFFHRKRCTRLFEAWREEWQRWRRQDQAALLRALAQCPVRIWLLGRDWNGGQLVEHLFGRCR